ISWLHLYTALFTGRGVPAGIRYGYFNIGDPEARAKMEDLARVEKLQVICLNDVPPPGGADEADPEWLAEWLARMYPNPTEFELAWGREWPSTPLLHAVGVSLSSLPRQEGRTRVVVTSGQRGIAHEGFSYSELDTCTLRSVANRSSAISGRQMSRSGSFGLVRLYSSGLPSMRLQCSP